MPEAVWFKLSGHELFVQHGIIALFGFGGRDVADGREQAPIFESVERGVFDGFK